MWHAKGLFARRNLLKESESFGGIKHVQNKQSHSMIHTGRNGVEEEKHPIYWKNYIDILFFDFVYFP